MIGRQQIVTLTCLAVTILFLVTPTFSLVRTVTEDARERCHQGLRDGRVRCGEYANLNKDRTKRQVPSDDDKKACPEGDDLCAACQNGTQTEGCPTGPPGETVTYPDMPEGCLDYTWGAHMNQTNSFGNCINMTTDSTHRYITSNNVPDFWVNSYCPIGLGYGYCIQAEIDAGTCYFTDLLCGEDNGAGSNDYGDVWVPQEDSYKIRLAGDPTQQDRPGDMYDATLVGAAKTNGAATAVATNGIGVQGPNDAGDVSIDEGGFQLPCGGHVTPPMGSAANTGNVPSGPPKYHFHKSPECLPAFTNASVGLTKGSQPNVHAQLMGWAIDGFGVYAYQDEYGAAPIVDECGGHFGPVDTGEVVYHYHSRPIVPYHLACQGPALGKCDDTQSGTNYCGSGCGAEVCVQPGTTEEALRTYLSKFNSTWLDSYTVNDYTKSTYYSSASGHSVSVVTILAAALVSYIFA